MVSRRYDTTFDIFGRNNNVRTEPRNTTSTSVVRPPHFSFSGVAEDNGGMGKKQESERDDGGVRAAESPPSATERSTPSIAAPLRARSLVSNPERANRKAVYGRRLVHRINLDLSGRAVAIFNLLLGIERAKLRGRRKLHAKDLAKVILENYLLTNEEQIFAHREAADEVERLAAGVGTRRRSTPRRQRSSPLRAGRTPSAPDAGHRSLRCA